MSSSTPYVLSIQMNFRDVTKETPIKDTYNEFLNEFGSRFSVDNNDLKNIGFVLNSDDSFVLLITNEKEYNDFFSVDKSIKYKVNRIIGKAFIIYDNEYMKKGILIEMEIRKNEDELKKYEEEIKRLLENKNSLIEKIKKKKNDLKENISGKEKKNKLNGLNQFPNNNKYRNYDSLDNKENILNSINNNDSYKNDFLNINQPYHRNEQSQKSKKEFDTVNEEIIEINQNIIYKENTIKHTVKITKKKWEDWPNNVLLFCVQDDSDIYFCNVNLKDEKVIKNYTNNEEIIYNIPIEIKFKSRKIEKKKYSLNYVLISDIEKFKKNYGKIIIRVI